MTKKKRSVGLIVIISMILLSIVALYFGGAFSTFTSGRVSLHQYNGNVDADWGDRVAKSGSVEIGSLQISQSKTYYAPVVSDYYCQTNTCGGEQYDIDDWGCPLWKTSRAKLGGCSDSGYKRAYCNVGLSGVQGLECVFNPRNLGRGCNGNKICRNGEQSCTASWTSGYWTAEVDAYGYYSCGGRTRSQDYVSSCHYKMTISNNGQSLFTSTDFSNKRKNVYIPVNPTEPLVEKELNYYDGVGGYVDCPYFNGETDSDCEILYGEKGSSRIYYIPKSQTHHGTRPGVLSSSVGISGGQDPIPYPEVGVWGDKNTGERYTLTDDFGGFVLAELRTNSQTQYGNCYLIQNSFSYLIPENGFTVDITPSKDVYIEGEEGSVDVFVFNIYEDGSMIRLNVLYAIPTAFGDKERLDQYIIELDKGLNTFTYDIPTEQVVDTVKVSVSGDIVIPGSYFSGINDACDPDRPGTLIPADTCDYVVLGSISEEQSVVSITKSEQVPQFCLERGITTIVACNEYVESNINALNLDINEQIALIESLTATQKEKLSIIVQLETNINEQSIIIDRFEMTIDEQRDYIAQLGLTLDEQDDLISRLEITVQEKQELVNRLETEVDDQARQILALELSVDEQAKYISDLNLNIVEQAELINRLTSNLQEKAYFVEQLEAENDRQAELIKEMEVSFANQGAIVEALDLTIEEDAAIISELTDKNDEQGKIIEGMNLELDEQRQIIQSLTDSNEEMGEIIAELNLKTSEQRVLIEALTGSIDEQAEIIAKMRLTNTEQKDLIEQLQRKVEEQGELINKLNKIIDREKGFFNMNAYYYVALAGVIGVVGGIILARKVKRRK